jgi:hypothetical protein
VRRERIFFAAIAVLLILVRSWAPTFLEGFFFDSDQAIVGLMALHLSTLHHFPLYYYGLHYLLGVQAWLIAAAFWLFHPSVAVMRLPLIALNLAVAIWVMVEAGVSAKIRPAVAFVAALPFVIPTPAVGTHLVEAAGASIEPFVYVLLLWRLRRRPLAFGAVLAIGTLHREFTLFALPALGVAIIATDGIGPFLNRSAIRFGAWSAVAVALVWLIVDDLKLRLEGGSLALQAASLGGQVCADPGDLRARAASLATNALPKLFGGAPMPLSALRMDTPLVAGSMVVGAVVGVALVAMTARSAWLVARRQLDGKLSRLVKGPGPYAERKLSRLVKGPGPLEAGRDGFGIYLAGVGACAALAYPWSCNVVPSAPPLMRYLLLALLFPVGIAIVFLQRERAPRLRAAAIAVFVFWGGANLADTIRLIRTSVVAPPLNERRVLTDYLTTHGIRYARANYWDAYVVDFLSQERIITASVDLVRIPEYQAKVDAHAKEAVSLDRLPCQGERIASWCVQKP